MLYQQHSKRSQHQIRAPDHSRNGCRPGVTKDLYRVFGINFPISLLQLRLELLSNLHRFCTGQVNHDEGENEQTRLRCRTNPTTIQDALHAKREPKVQTVIPRSLPSRSSPE